MSKEKLTNLIEDIDKTIEEIEQNEDLQAFIISLNTIKSTCNQLAMLAITNSANPEAVNKLLALYMGIEKDIKMVKNGDKDLAATNAKIKEENKKFTWQDAIEQEFGKGSISKLPS